MSSGDNNGSNDSGHPRRGSFNTQALAGLFNRSGSTGTPAFPTPISTTAAQDHQRRRMSVTGVGLSATSPTTAFSSFNRRSSVSTASSDAIDENAIEDDDASARSGPNTPFGRRMSFGAHALRNVRGGSSPGNDEGFNWSERFRSRAESTVSQAQRPVVSKLLQPHERAHSVSDLQPPPTTMPTQAATKPKPIQQERPKPDAIGERILRGQFMMD